MNSELLEKLEAASRAIKPQSDILHAALGTLNRATRLASEEKLDAIAMHKLLTRLEEAAAQLDNPTMLAAVTAFATETQNGLDALAFEFARDLRDTFEQRGQAVHGRPPTLVVDSLALHMDMGGRKAQWFYGKEPLTHPIPLSLNAIVKAYDQQKKSIILRVIDVPAFVAEIYRAWQELLAKRQKAPSGKRINIVEVYSQVTMNRQSSRFWISPSRSNFKDYDRAHFVRDLTSAHNAPTVAVDGETYHLRLGVATKSQAGNPARSIWLPQSALEGDYYADLTFAKE